MEQLGAKQNETNNYIVSTVRRRVQVLKECKSETQRQQYRQSLTLLAPELGNGKGVDAPKVVVINSTELRWHSIEMDLLEATGPTVRRSARTAARGSGSGEHLARKYRLPIDAEVAILKECW